MEFFNSLVIHNLLFKDTAYTFLGFAEKGNSFQAVLKQPFITSDGPVDLSDVKELLAYNGFENTKRNDYYNKELGLILEDIHDENVIVTLTLYFSSTLYFIRCLNPTPGKKIKITPPLFHYFQKMRKL